MPYFEVDLADPQGPTTLFAVGNTDSDPVVARVVVWTNRGIAQLTFDVILGPYDLQTFDMRRILEIDLPETADTGHFSSCEEPTWWSNDPFSVALLQRALLGIETYEGSDLCEGVPSDQPDLAVGFVTVDAMNDCYRQFTYPGGGHELPLLLPYFEMHGTGKASNRNVLWGNVQLVDSSQDLAFGMTAVALTAQPSGSPPLERSFYQNLIGGSTADGRLPLPSAYLGRFVSGGSFDGGSSMVFWTEPYERVDTLLSYSCSSGPTPLGCGFIDFLVRNEQGEAQHEWTIEGELATSRLLTVPSEELPIPISFGQLEFSRREIFCGAIIPGFPQPPPRQAFMATVLSAQGRFSTTVLATPVDSSCAED